MDTKQTDSVTFEEFRTLRFQSIEDLLAEIDRILEAEKKGTLWRSGNWTTGQIFGHLAAWINYGYEGFPRGAHPPFFIRWLMRPLKKKYLKNGMPRGVRIPRAEGGTFGTEEMSSQEGADRLRKALARMQNLEPAKYHSPAFGPMLGEERVALNLRHAELHLGYLHP